VGADDGFLGSTLLGKLRVVKLLGSGGLGSVYEVEHLITHHRHAMKVLHARHAMNSDAVSRLVREAGVSGRVKSDRLVSTLDVGQLADGRTYVLMELLEGRSWREMLRAQGTVHPQEAVRLGLQVAESLSAAHAAGVIHRDLKPDNVFLVRTPSGEQVKLLDFGLAKNLPGFTDQFGALTVDGGLMGTPQYLSPEQGVGKADVDGRADQYALGVMLYESLSGHPPFVGANIAEVITRIHEGRYRPLLEVAPHVTPDLAATVERAMNVDRDTRHPTMDAFRAALGQHDARATGTGRTDAFRSPFSSDPPAAPLAIAATRPGERLLTAPPLTERPPTTAFAPPSPTKATRSGWVLGLLVVGALLVAGLGVLGWRLLRPRRVRPVPPLPAAIEPDRAVTSPEQPEPREPTLPAGPSSSEALAAVHPSALVGMTRTNLSSPEGAIVCVQTDWSGARGVSLVLAVCDGIEDNPNLLSRREPMDTPAALYFLREVTRGGRSMRYEWTAATGQGQAEVLIAGRFRVAALTTGSGDPEASLRYLERIDLAAIERLATRP